MPLRWQLDRNRHAPQPSRFSRLDDHTLGGPSTGRVALLHSGPRKSLHRKGSKTAIGLACTISSFGYYTCWTLLTVSPPSCALSQRLGTDPASRPCSPSSPTRHPCSPCFPSPESGQSASQLSSSSSDSASSACSPGLSSSRPHTRTAPPCSAVETGPPPAAPWQIRTRGGESGVETTRACNSPLSPSVRRGRTCTYFDAVDNSFEALATPRLTFYTTALQSNFDRLDTAPLPHNGSTARAKAPTLAFCREMITALWTPSWCLPDASYLHHRRHREIRPATSTCPR